MGGLARGKGESTAGDEGKRPGGRREYSSGQGRREEEEESTAGDVGKRSRRHHMPTIAASLFGSVMKKRI